MALKFEDMLEQLGDQGRKALLDTYALYEQGLIDRDTFTEVASHLLEYISDAGANYGRAGYAELISYMKEQPVQPPTALGSASVQQQSAIQQSLVTILDGDPEQILGRLERLGYVLPIEATQQGWSDELTRDEQVEGWYRGIDRDACQLCQWWSWEGRVWPKVQPFQSHKGCKCQQIPTLVNEFDLASTVYSRALERREQAIANRDKRSAEVRALIAAGEL